MSKSVNLRVGDFLIYLLLCISVLPALCMYVGMNGCMDGWMVVHCVCLVPTEDRRVSQSPWNWSYERL